MTAAQQQFEVRKHKLDGGLRTHRATLVEDGPEGAWFFSPAGTVAQTEHEPWRQPADGLQLFSATGRFVAWCWAPAPGDEGEFWSRRWVSVDVADNVTVTSARAEFVDLELDLWCNATKAGIVDQDELAAALASGLIDEERAGRAERTAGELYEQLPHGVGHAWDRRGWELLERLSGVGR